MQETLNSQNHLKNRPYAYVVLFILLCNLSFAQSLSKISIKVGPTIIGQKKTPPGFAEGGMTNGFSASLEPTLFTFGSKKQFDFTADISFIRKGGANRSPIFTYDPNGIPLGVGSETYKVTIDYLSLSPTLKMNFKERFFVKAGPRVDAFINFRTKDRFDSDPRTKKDFDPVTYGVTYGFGMTTNKEKMNLIFEFLAQNDLSKSSYNKASGQTFRNNCYLINLGMIINLDSE